MSLVRSIFRLILLNWRRFVVPLTAVVVVGLLGAAAFFFWPHGLPEVAASPEQPQRDELIAKGKYLTIAADCEACHTTPGGEAFVGGLAFKLPFGTMYSPNITPDPETGIGTWSDAEFVRAVRSGVGKHGEDLYPAFPYTSYALLSTDDILAIRAYLKTLRPIKYTPPENDLLFPFNQRYVMRSWKLLFVPWGQYHNDPAKSEAWNKGAYLVEALAHCGECHTPRGLMFQREQGKALSGGAVDGWIAWNITSDKASGIGSWSDEEIADYLSRGHAQGRGPAAAAMRQAIELSLSKLTKADIGAITTYLRDVPAQSASYGTPTTASVVPAAQASEPWNPHDSKESEGERIFEGACASCHGWDGSGQNTTRASLTGSHSIKDPTATNLLRIILDGSSDGVGTPTTAMPGFADAFSDAEIAALANYVTEHFDGRKGTVTPRDVAKARSP
ncbi:c-type cytochrome [Rhizobium calliandrae]|uniref:C-type cytochrome n=1 Tax=Rhizobium calliandrae TaxID=1312182 RepID=A0ABT7KIG5_9HYPH|nr:c-type cytochrome [Rhizobium calliandrae]MDL2407748.1 c-type cytochrome [Rhizobium calliandrae]